MSRAALIALVLWLTASVAAAAEPPLRDPMQPYRASAGDGPGAVPVPRFRLTGVLISSERRIAIVNGKRYAQGALVDGAEITHIEAQSIRLRDGAAELVVHLGKERDVAPAVAGETGP